MQQTILNGTKILNDYESKGYIVRDLTENHCTLEVWDVVFKKKRYDSTDCDVKIILDTIAREAWKIIFRPKNKCKDCKYAL